MLTMAMICVTSVLRNAILYSMCIPSSYSLAKCMWLYNIYIYICICISVQSSRRFFKSYFRTICFDIFWSGVVFLWRSVHILWAEKEVQNHSHACRNTQTCQCLLVFWLCVWCKLKLTIYTYIYIYVLYVDICSIFYLQCR